MENAEYVDRVENPSKELFDAEYGLRFKPVLITGVMNNWPAKSKWNNEYFKLNFKEISAWAVRSGNEKDKRKFTIADYFSYLEKNTDDAPYYLKNCKFHLNTDMINDYYIPEYFMSYLDILGNSLPINFKLSWMYIGATGTSSPLHLDIYNTSAWNAVFSGRKIWFFYPPNEAPYLYNGQVNAFEPDLKAYPKFAKAKPLICVQSLGEIVFTPSGWWHAVYNEVGGISLTENFVNDTNYDVVSTTLQLLGKEEELKVVDECKRKFQQGEDEHLII